MEKDIFVLKNEAFFMSLNSHAKYTLEITEKNNGHIYRIAEHIVKYFGVAKSRYSLKRSIKIKDYLRSEIDPIIKMNSSPALLMLITLNYLLSEVEHYETKVAFGMHCNTVKELLEEMECSSIKEKMLEHYTRMAKLWD